MGASLALAGVTACTRQPTENIVPYVRAPEELIPGKPLFYATAMPLRRRRHRPAGREPHGPPDQDRRQPGHPASLGATDAFCQASVLTLYDPDRSQTITHYGEITSWNAFLGQFRADRRRSEGEDAARACAF